MQHVSHTVSIEEANVLRDTLKTKRKPKQHFLTLNLRSQALCYIPGVNVGLGTRPLHAFHWMPSLPYSILIFVYDECRKYAMRWQRIK